MATALGVSPATAYRDTLALRPPPDENGMIEVGKTMGLDGKVRPNRRVYTGDRDARILELRAAGRSVRAIASECECSVGTVHRIIKRNREA